MTLGEKQEEFTLTMARFLVWVYECTPYRVRSGEWFRSREEAERLARLGAGIRNSQHCRKLAADIFLSHGGLVTWDYDDYLVLGEKWKTMHPLARWGGDFRNRDAVHFSFEHRGTM